MISKRMKMTCLTHPDERAVGESMMVEMKWDPFLPMEVRMDVGSDDEWQFGRNLLLEGLVGPSGLPGVSDVMFSPWGELEIRMVLETDEFEASFVFAQKDVLNFSQETVARIHPNDEQPLWVDWDVQFLCLQAKAIPLRRWE